MRDLHLGVNFFCLYVNFLSIFQITINFFFCPSNNYCENYTIMTVFDNVLSLLY